MRPRAAVAAAACCGAVLGGCGGTETTTVTLVQTETQTVATTVTETAAAAGLPAQVEQTRAEILEAADSGDYEQLRPLIPDQFSYTFGGPIEGGPIAFWENVEATSGARPIEILRDLLRLPYALERGIYVWPFAVDQQPDDLTDYERRLLRSVGGDDLSDDFGAGTGYLGWRVGISPGGDWLFFIAGD